MGLEDDALAQKLVGLQTFADSVNRAERKAQVDKIAKLAALCIESANNAHPRDHAEALECAALLRLGLEILEQCTVWQKAERVILLQEIATLRERVDAVDALERFEKSR